MAENYSYILLPDRNDSNGSMYQHLNDTHLFHTGYYINGTFVYLNDSRTTTRSPNASGIIKSGLNVEVRNHDYDF